MSINASILFNLLKEVIIEFFRRFKQPQEEMTCPTVLVRQKSGYRLETKCLMKKASVQPPLIAIGQ